MQLTSTDLTTLCKYAIEAAKKAGQLINHYATKDVDVKRKEAAESLASQVVTEVDLKAQQLILSVLSPTLEKYDLALLTEESTDNKSRLTKDYFWCIDPMDGTLAFTEKTWGYAVSIALVAKNGESQLGVVFDPRTNTLYHAVKGQGAYKNQKPWKKNLSSGHENSFRLYIDRSFLQHKNYETIMQKIKKRLTDLGFIDLSIEKQAGAVLNACMVIDKAPGCYFKVPKPKTGGGSLWDFAATSCLFNELGATACSFDGSALDLNRSDSTFMNHRGVLYASNPQIADIIRRIQ